MSTKAYRLRDGAFDRIAADYDSSFTSTRFGRQLRAIVWRSAERCFVSRRRILDIGCGTGEDAVYLASLGHDVLATDASERMLEIARRKSQEAGYDGRIDCRLVAIESLAEQLQGQRFDGAFSNFGALNCAGDLEHAVRALASLMRPNSPIVLVVMGRWVPWEWGWYLARLDWRKAFRRFNRSGIGWRGLTISYPTPAVLARALGSHFVVTRRQGLGIVLPPTYASDWLERRPAALSALVRAETFLRRWQPLAALADHYVLEGRRWSAEFRSQCFSGHVET